VMAWWPSRAAASSQSRTETEVTPVRRHPFGRT
jgi:hypothetical protein